MVRGRLFFSAGKHHVLLKRIAFTATSTTIRKAHWPIRPADASHDLKAVIEAMKLPLIREDRETNRRRLLVRGVVQGVGFRPYVYHLAGRFELTGFVRNTAVGVVIEVEGGVANYGLINVHWNGEVFSVFNEDLQEKAGPVSAAEV